jgi:hypothetical protein
MMGTNVLLVVVLTLLALGAAGPLAAQSLADVARQEEARRNAVKAPSKLLTNDDLRSVPVFTSPSDAPPLPAADGSIPSESEADAEGGTTDRAAEDGEPPAGEPARDQAYWSGRAKELQTQLTRDQTFREALQSRVNGLTTEYVNQSDPVQQARVATQRQDALTELERVTRQIDESQQAIVALEEEARRAGVPPGWLR